MYLCVIINREIVRKKMGYDVFISYSRRDIAIVNQFAEKLTSAGYSVWFDRIGVSRGREFRNRMVQAINESTVVLFFLSIYSNDSERNLMEIMYSKIKKKDIILVRLDGSEYDDSIFLDICGNSFIKHDPDQPLSCFDEITTNIGIHTGHIIEVTTIDSNMDKQNSDLLYKYGKSCYDKKDYGQAFQSFKMAAEQGSAEAQFRLGKCYDKGEGVEQDYSEAVKWYLKAAEQGNAKAQFNLGNIYRKGEGVDQDYNEAVKWYRKAADQGNKNAIQALKQLK